MNPKLKAILFALFMTLVASADLVYISRKYLRKRAKNSH